MKIQRKGRTVRVTISIPKGLRQKMNRHQESNGQVNWSLVARRAIREYIKNRNPETE